jgi:SAM-dependent methyltransferase
MSTLTRGVAGVTSVPVRFGVASGISRAIVIFGPVRRPTHERDPGTGRSLERLRAHWEIERELADRLRAASREQRGALYSAVYDELFLRVPDHPQVVGKADPTQRLADVRAQEIVVKQFLGPGETIVEVGAGDCALSLALASFAGAVYAVEVSREIAETDAAPANFELLITDGRAIPLAPDSVDLVYSNQLMEHLHPDDAAEQLHNIFRCLRHDGRYVCFTPNRLLGPSDISQFFEDDVANGFHLREYSQRELRDLLLETGFGRVQTIASLRGRVWPAPIGPIAAAEVVFEALPRSARLRLKRAKPIRKLLDPGGGVVATKLTPTV